MLQWQLSINNNNTTTTILRPLYRSTCVSQHLQSKLEDFVGAKFNCPHALADSNQGILIREKKLEFSSTVLPTVYTVSVP